MSNCPDTNGSDYNVIKHESTGKFYICIHKLSLQYCNSYIIYKCRRSKRCCK